MKLSPSYYQQTDTLGLAHDLLGKVLVTRFEGQLTSGRIVETGHHAALLAAEGVYARLYQMGLGGETPSPADAHKPSESAAGG